MVNVLVVGMSPIIGGIEIFLINVFRKIDKNKIHFDFMTFYPKCAFEKEIIESGSKIFNFTRRGKNPIKSYFEQKKFFKNNKKTYDFVWIHLSSSSNIITNKLAKKYTNAKVISHCHGIDFESKPGIVRKTHTILSKINFNRFIKCTDYAFACSQAAGEWLFKEKKEVIIIKNGIETEKFLFENQIRNQIRKELKLNEDTFVIGHVGRFCEAKNHDFLIDVYKEYYKKNSNSALVLVGTGDLEEEIKQKVKDYKLEQNVKFLGYRNNINEIYNIFDVFVLPSLFEGFPISAIEAQANELPCILSDTITREVDMIKNIVFLPIDNCFAWSDAIMSINEFDREKHTNNNKIIEAGYDLNSTKNFLENFLKSKK
ncbi:MAG: glycosyltransferase [Acutalibacteraceae bacterium]